MGVLSVIPTPIGLGASGLVAAETSQFDVKIGDLEFMLAVGPDNPLIRRGAPYRSEQVNFSGEPGETALGFWWQREQSSWHYGADNPTFDGPGSGDPDIAVNRFSNSWGINVWEPGQISLCDDTIRLAEHPTGSIVGPVNAAPDGSTEAVYWGVDDTLYEWFGTTVFFYNTAEDPMFGWDHISSLASDGTVVWILDSVNDSLWGVGDIDGDGNTESIELYTGMPNATRTNSLRFAKQRLIAAYDNALYEIDHSVQTTTAFAGTPFFTHPKDGWTWTDISEGPGAIYASGFIGSYSAVYKFVLDDDGLIPTLSSGIVACELPAGEKVYKLFPYIGIFIALGTTEGVRVCSFADTDIALAPLTYEDTAGTGAIGITGWGDFLYANVRDAGDGYNGLIKIDLSKEIEPGRFAWANDMRANTSSTAFAGIQSDSNDAGRMTTLNGRPVFAIFDHGVFARYNSRRSPEGQITSGRMLFGMTDPKHFLRIAMQGSGEGTVTLSTGVDSDEASLPQTTVDFAQLSEVDLAMQGLQGSSLTIGLTMTRDEDDLNAGPTVTAYSAKALPAQPRERQWILPLRCYDRVEKANGQTEYGSAKETLSQLEEYVRSQEPVILQTFFGDPDRDWTSVLVHIEDCEYRQIQYQPKAAWGGVLTVSCRTITG